jgi:hypothetical protein
MTGAILYGALRSVGWVQQMPELLKAPMAEGSPLQALRGSVGRLRERARRIGEPLDPDLD